MVQTICVTFCLFLWLAPQVGKNKPNPAFWLATRATQIASCFTLAIAGCFLQRNGVPYAILSVLLTKLVKIMSRLKIVNCSVKMAFCLVMLLRLGWQPFPPPLPLLPRKKKNRTWLSWPPSWSLTCTYHTLADIHCLHASQVPSTAYICLLTYLFLCARMLLRLNKSRNRRPRKRAF